MSLPRVVMTLLVRDEEDILEANVDYHLAQGVDFVIATDNLSEDASREILLRYQHEGVLRLIDETGDDFAQRDWVTRMARMAAGEYGADWVINNDSDEFWWPEQGTLKETLGDVPPEVELLYVPRVNFLPRVNETGHPLERMVVRESCSTEENGWQLQPKACHRGRADVAISQGNHEVWPPLPARYARGLMVIFHFPFRTYAQFEGTVAKGGAALERNTELGPEVGYHRRAHYREWQAGRLESVYRERVLDESTLESRLGSRDLVLDRRLLDFLRARCMFAA